MHRNADLVEILSLLEIDESIPIEVYSVVAKIFTYIYEQNQQNPPNNQTNQFLFHFKWTLKTHIKYLL